MKAREHELELTIDVLSVLLKCCDQLTVLIETTTLDGKMLTDELIQKDKELLVELKNSAGLADDKADISETESNLKIGGEGAENQQ